MTPRLHTIVGFIADFPAKAYGPEHGVEPAGKELSVFLHSELNKAGFTVAAPEDYEGWAWDICVRDGAAEVTTRVGLVDDMNTSPPRQWLVTNDGYTIRPFLKRLFGGAEKTADHEPLLRRVCNVLHTAMANDARFSHLKWYDAQTFDKPGDVPTDKP